MLINIEKIQLESCGKMNCLINISIIKSNYFWFPIINILFNYVNIFIHTEYLITKLDIIFVANFAYSSTGLIIPSSFINTGQSFKSHPNTHA
jgi:hypothetical protein